jgi:hypothetical protein
MTSAQEPPSPKAPSDPLTRFPERREQQSAPMPGAEDPVAPDFVLRVKDYVARGRPAVLSLAIRFSMFPRKDARHAS